MSARLAGPDLAPSDAALLAVAAAYAQWHAANRFSAATGAPTTAIAGGAGRRCSSSRASVYPRIDPAVIMLVTAEGGRQASRGSGHKGAAAQAGDWALLGRKAEWPPGRYSTLAGFLEVGEPLELAVARETEEESGVRVELGSVTYAASQPWPFPRSLMIGFFASAAPLDRQHAAPLVLQPQQGSSSSSDSSRGSTGKGYELLSHEGRRAAMDVKLAPQEVDRVLCDCQLPALQVDHRELEDCKWFHRDWLHACLLGPNRGQVPGQADFHVPGPWSLAHRLIHTWLAARDTAPGAAGHTNTDLLSPGRWSGEEVPQVAIDVGTFKYVLMRLSQAVEGEEARSKLLVWGDCRAAYHMNVFQSAKAVARRLGLAVEVLGGGRIAHTPERRSIAIYGYSAAFGPAPHEVTAALVRKWFPLYRAEDITVSYEGY
ncbi:hypothetical protein V8C86DRAFT_2626918 [Haematococcus lacustris]